MFKNLNNLSYKRTALEAFGFLLVFGILGMFIGAVSNMILTILFDLPANNLQEGMDTIKHTGKYIWLIAGIYVSLINIIVAKSKNCLTEVGSIFSIIISFILTFFAGCFLGLVPSAIMTTKEVAQK